MELLSCWQDISDVALFGRLNVTRGATLAVNKSSADTFDAIVYAERQPKRWMAGSSFFRRTQDADPGFEEKETGKLIQLAISYEDDGGNAKIVIYRNGEVIKPMTGMLGLIWVYTQGPIVSWKAGDVEALFAGHVPSSVAPLMGGSSLAWRTQESTIPSSVRKRLTT